MSRADLLHDAKLLVIGLVIGLLLAGGACAWLKLKPSLSSVLAPPADELAKEETKRLDCKPVLVYRDKVEKKLGLPDIVTKDPGKHVVAASPVPPSDYPHTMTAVYDDRSGGVDMFLRQDPLPWLAFNRRGALGVAYGARSEASGFVTRVYGRMDLLQIKRLHAGLLGDVDNAGGWYGGGFAEMHW
jgi:hypothetical protein